MSQSPSEEPDYLLANAGRLVRNTQGAMPRGLVALRARLYPNR